MLRLARGYARAAVHELVGVHDDWREFATGIGVEALYALALALIALAVVEVMVLIAA